MRQFSRTLWFSVGLVSLLLVGCFNESVKGDVTTITFAQWVIYVTLGGSVVGIIAGWMLRKIEKLQGWCFLLMAGGVLALAFFLPCTILDEIVIDPRHFTLKTGFWFYPTTHDIKFAEILRIEVHSEISYSRRGRHTSISLLCFKKRGGTERVPAGDMMKSCLDQVLIMAVAQGVAVIDKTAE